MISVRVSTSELHGDEIVSRMFCFIKRTNGNNTDFKSTLSTVTKRHQTIPNVDNTVMVTILIDVKFACGFS